MVYRPPWPKIARTPMLTCTRSCLINTNCLKLSSILRFCSLFRHLIVLLIYIFYHLIISCRLNMRFHMQSCVHSFFCPTDRPTFTRGRAMGNETFYGDGLNQKKKLYVPYGSLNFIRLLRVVITPSEEKTTRSNRMNFRLRWVPLPFSPSFGFCSSFLVWFCFLWNWPPL